jgi:anti-sigma factor RsiW
MSERPPHSDDALAAALHGAFADVRAPAGLEKRLAGSLRALPISGRAALPWRGPLAAAAALMVGLGIVLWAPRTTVLADVPLKELEAFIESDRRVDLATDDPARVRGWLTPKVDFTLPPVARGREGIELIGGRLCLFAGRRVASYMYRVHGRLLSIYIMTADGLHSAGREQVEHAGRTITLTQERHLSQASWAENDLVYAVVGDMSAQALLAAWDSLQR